MPTSKKPTQRERNRAAFPECARVVDEFRRVFGEGVKVVWWSEGGKTIGSKPDENHS